MFIVDINQTESYSFNTREQLNAFIKSYTKKAKIIVYYWNPQYHRAYHQFTIEQ